MPAITSQPRASQPQTRVSTRAIEPAAFDNVDVRGKAVLVATGWDEHWGTEAYLSDNPFLTAAAATNRTTEVRTENSLVLQESLLFSSTIAENIRYGRLEATQEEIEAHPTFSQHPAVKAGQITGWNAGGTRLDFKRCDNVDVKMGAVLVAFVVGGALLLFDVNNVYVSAFNHGFSTDDFLHGVPRDRVVQFHVAGHSHEESHIIDTHDGIIATS